MSDDGLVSVYRAPDMAAAALLVSLLEERGIPVFQQEVSLTALPTAKYGVWGYRVMITREDLTTRHDEVLAAVREFERTRGYRPTV